MLRGIGNALVGLWFAVVIMIIAYCGEKVMDAARAADMQSWVGLGIFAVIGMLGWWVMRE